jgi:hypothetical protein
LMTAKAEEFVVVGPVFDEQQPLVPVVARIVPASAGRIVVAGTGKKRRKSTRGADAGKRKKQR